MPKSKHHNVSQHQVGSWSFKYFDWTVFLILDMGLYGVQPFVTRYRRNVHKLRKPWCWSGASEPLLAPDYATSNSQRGDGQASNPFWNLDFNPWAAALHPPHHYNRKQRKSPRMYYDNCAMHLCWSPWMWVGESEWRGPVSAWRRWCSLQRLWCTAGMPGSDLRWIEICLSLCTVTPPVSLGITVRHLFGGSWHNKVQCLCNTITLSATGDCVVCASIRCAVDNARSSAIAAGLWPHRHNQADRKCFLHLHWPAIAVLRSMGAHWAKSVKNRHPYQHCKVTRSTVQDNATMHFADWIWSRGGQCWCSIHRSGERSLQLQTGRYTPAECDLL